MIPSCVSNEDAHLTEVEWGRELIDVPGTSKLRVLTGMEILLLASTLRNEDVIGMLLSGNSHYITHCSSPRF